MVVSGILAGAAPVRAQSEAGLSAIGFPILVGSIVAVSTIGAASTAVASIGPAAATLSEVGNWSITSIVMSGVGASLVLRDASGTIEASFTVPGRVATALGLRPGDRLRTTATEAGTLLHKDGRVVAFVVAPQQQHLVQHVALSTR